MFAYFPILFVFHIPRRRFLDDFCLRKKKSSTSPSSHIALYITSRGLCKSIKAKPKNEKNIKLMLTTNNQRVGFKENLYLLYIDGNKPDLYVRHM